VNVEKTRSRSRTIFVPLSLDQLKIMCSKDLKIPSSGLLSGTFFA
jgi:hypothetical protein